MYTGNEAPLTDSNGVPNQMKDNKECGCKKDDEKCKNPYKRDFNKGKINVKIDTNSKCNKCQNSCGCKK